MARTLQTKLEIRNWDEKPYREFANGTKLARAEVTLASTDIGDPTFTGEGSFDSLLYYRADGTSTFVATMVLTGTLEGREGSVVLQGDGSFDGTTARLRVTVVDADGELAGTTGSAESVSTHADYPNMPLTLTYDLP